MRAICSLVGAKALNDVASLGRLLLAVGALLVLVGLVLVVGGRFLPIGRLPGDILLRRGRVQFYFPLATCLLLSLILSVLSRLLRR